MDPLTTAPLVGAPAPLKRKGIFNNKLDMFDDPDYEIVETDAVFSPVANALPFIQNAQAPRAFYGSRFFEQALPLAQREAPLVKNLNPESGRSWDYLLGKSVGAVLAPDDGIVDNVSDDEIVVKFKDGSRKTVDLFNKHPLNRNTMLHNTAKVVKGDVVTKDQVLATSNFTDDDGRMALGANATVAITPFKGETMDDAAVISESFAQRLTSEHANMLDLEVEEGSKVGRGHFMALFPKKFSKAQLDSIGDDGFVKPGSILNPGDPIRLATKPKTFRSDTADVARLSRSARAIRKDDSAVWDGDDPAEVLDVVRNRKGDVRVLVKYSSPARQGDKLSLRNGQKMTITRVLPEDQVPVGEDGKPFDLVLNQLGLPSRVNAASFYETLLGKYVKRTGKTLAVPSSLPGGKSVLEYVEERMAEAGIDPRETIYDPMTKSNLDQRVTTGVAHVLKLHHTAGKKIRYRGKGGYDINRQPMKGGSDGGGAQRMSGLEMSVMQSSGARGVQKEGMLLRGEYRPEYWRAIRDNRPPPTLGKPFVWEKFMALLQGSGVNPRDFGGGKIRLTPLTDKDFDAREAVELENGRIVNQKTLIPEKGGLFDPVMTSKQSWGKITLPVAVVNPAYEAQVRALLGLKQKELDEILDT